MTRPLRVGLLLAAAACGGPAGPREVGETSFAAPPDTMLTRYVNVPVAAPLGGERWVVVAGEFDEAVLLDFGAGTSRPLGGKGEAEVRSPFSAFAFSDTAYVADWSLRRLTRWDASGRFHGTVPAQDALRGLLPSARDAAGRFYFEVKPVVGRGGRGAKDSAAVVRASADFARFDTVARLSPLDLAEVEDQAGRRFERRVFSGEDEWGVFPDGTVWVARVYQNHIIRCPPGGEPVKGENLPDKVIEVSFTDRKHFVLQFPEDQRTTAEQLPVAPLHPPFTNALSTPAGSIWLEKSRSFTDSVRTYQVVDSRGALSHLVILPSRQGRVVALTDSLALVAEQYKEGVRLMQVAIPAAPPPPGPR